MEEFLEILKSLLVADGVGSKKEKTSYIFLRLSAIALTIASGYTTFEGFLQYTPFLVAILLTVGVQGLLFASVWKIGSAIKSNRLRPMIVVIFSIAMLVSVFFSYSSLLEVIYEKKVRVSDEIVRKQNEVTEIVSLVKDSISGRIDITKACNNFKSGFITWDDTSSKGVSKSIATLTNLLDRSTSKQKAIEYALSKNQQKFTNNPSSENKKALEFSKRKEKDNSENKLFPTLTKYERIVILQMQHDSIYKSITSNNRLITLSSISDFQQKKKEYYPLILGSAYSEKNIELPDTLKKQLIRISEVNEFYNFVDSLKVSDYKTIPQLKYSALSLIDRIPSSFKIDFSKVKSKLLSLDKYTGEQQHQFIVSVMLLKQGHFLAVGAFIIALFVDLLVLFCGILGTLPKSFLTLNNYKEIEEVMESGIENIFSMHFNENYETSFKKRLYLLISNCEPSSIEYTVKGFPSFIRFDKIKELSLSSEIGILISTNQAKDFKSKDGIFITMRFLLWASEKLNTK
ncbi:MAG: hypothetical protein K1X55_18040 [Chitinophagales bacterium]|nr:hypothetical protein [Chitinophagales bacterium]